MAEQRLFNIKVLGIITWPLRSTAEVEKKDLGSGGESRGGSSPSARTILSLHRIGRGNWTSIVAPSLGRGAAPGNPAEFAGKLEPKPESR